MKKRLITIMIVVAMALSVLPEKLFMEEQGLVMTASAAVYEEEPTYGDYKYTILDDGTVGIRGYEGSAKKITIPGTINGKSVTVIMMEAFCGNTKLTSVTIPDSVDCIGADAFSDCSALASISIPESVTCIGDYAFQNCSKLKSISISNNVSYVGYCAFRNSGWYNDQPDGVLYKDGWCVDYKNASYDETSISIKNGIKAIAGEAFYCRSELTSITIPDSVTYIGGYAFGYCTGLTSITIPEGVTYIEDKAFEGCSGLTSITIPDSVSYIGGAAFWGCSGIASISIPDSVTEIGSNAFTETKWYKKQSDGLVYKDGWCLSYKGTISKNVRLSIAEGTKAIADYTLSGCDYLTAITFPKNVTSIGNEAFSNCSRLTTVSIPEGAAVGERAFFGCDNLMKVTVPDSVTSIGTNAFGYYYKEDNIERVVDFQIYCNAGSAAETYAVKNGFWCPTITTIKPDKIELSESKVTLGIKKTYRIVAEISPANANMGKAISYTSSKTKIARVDKKTGKITGVSKGTAIITAKTANGKTAKIKVIVE